MKKIENVPRVKNIKNCCEIIISIKDKNKTGMFSIKCIELINNTIVNRFPKSKKGSYDVLVNIDYNKYKNEMNDIRECFCNPKLNTSLSQEIRTSGWKRVLKKIGFSLYSDFQNSVPFSDCFKEIMDLYELKQVEFIHFIFEGSYDYIIGFPIEFINRGDKYIFLEYENIFMSKRIEISKRSSNISPFLPDDLIENLPIFFHIILSDAIDTSTVDEKQMKSKLDSFKKEADMLEKKLIDYKMSFDYKIEVKRFDDNNATVDGLRNYINKLSNNYYHVFHFIAEGTFDPDSGGTILFNKINNKTGKKEIDYLYSNDLANLLKSKKVKFVYLSCCLSAASEENTEKKNNFGILKALACIANIPSILGFRWPIDIELSTYFALEFYDKFFNDHKLPRATQLARYYIKTEGKNLSKRNQEKVEKEDHTWASPLLIYQNNTQQDLNKNKLPLEYGGKNGLQS